MLSAMCGGMEYEIKDPKTGLVVRKKAFFPIPKVQIPVMDEQGIHWARWGKRKGEDPEIDVPVTGWARLISLKEGKWNHYQPRRVKIPALRWMEKDGAKTSHWFDMSPDHCLLGVEIERQWQGESLRFVYVVTKPSSGLFADVHDRMPVLTKAVSPSVEHTMLSV